MRLVDGDRFWNALIGRERSRFDAGARDFDAVPSFENSRTLPSRSSSVAPPLEAGTFDRVVTSLVLHHHLAPADKRTALYERCFSFLFLYALVGISISILMGTSSCSTTQARPQSELEPVPNTPDSLDVEVGTGFSAFEPLANEDAGAGAGAGADAGPDASSVELTYGPQGGFHIWTSVRLKDLSVEEVQINVSSRYVDGGAPAGPASRWPARLLTVNGAREHVGMRNFVDQASQVADQRVVLRAEVVASNGRHGAGERIVIPRLK